MRISKHSSSQEKRVLTAMVVDSVALGRIAARWPTGGLFGARHANTIGQMCVDYHRQFDGAPGEAIEGLFAAWAAKEADDDTIDLVGRFIETLSDEHDDLAEASNTEYACDVAGELFNTVAIRRLADELKGHVDRGDPTAAVEALTQWGRVDLGVTSAVNVLDDEAAMKEAFTRATEPLIEYPGALGKFVGNQFARDDFIALLGSTGRGKSWWLMDLAWMAMRQGRKVALFEVGDMSQANCLQRFGTRAARHPKKAGTFKIPTKLSIDEDYDAVVEYEDRTFDTGITHQIAVEALQGRQFRFGRENSLIKLSTHASIGIAGIMALLDVWSREGWDADVVLIDYADILEPPPGITDLREGIDYNWRKMRQISQERHCLVVTATQGDTSSYVANLLTLTNFSDSRKKNDHPTGILGLNMNDSEKAAGLYRLNWLKRRNEEFNPLHTVHVAGSLALGRPHIKSAF